MFGWVNEWGQLQAHLNVQINHCSRKVIPFTERKLLNEETRPICWSCELQSLLRRYWWEFNLKWNCCQQGLIWRESVTWGDVIMVTTIRITSCIIVYEI
jgi:hypothetical protein